MFEEYYLHTKPSIYPEDYVMDIVRGEMKCNYGAAIHINHVEMAHYPKEYEKHLKRRVAQEFGNKMLEEGKIEFKAWDNPYMGKELRAETFCFTKKEIFDLLGKFGIHIKMNPTLEK